MYVRILLSALLILGLATVGIGCDTVDSTDETGTLRVLLTDAPGDVLSAVVTIESIYLQAEDDEDDADRILLRDDPVTVNLLTLQNEVLALVEDEVVPEGDYSQLRLVISGGYIEVEQTDGSSSIYASSDAYAAAHGVERTGALQMPSFSTSGLKVTLPPEARSIEGDQNVVLLDFDVAESFGHQAGQSGQWVMHPVIHASDFALTGSGEVALTLDDGVTLPDETLTLADFNATLNKEGDVLRVPFDDPDDDGTFTADFLYLPPGSYPVTITAPEGLALTTEPALPLNLTVENGEAVEATVLVTGVAEE